MTPDLIIAHEPEALSVAVVFCKRSDTPLLFDAHEFYPAQRGITPARTRWLEKLLRRAAPSVSAMTTVSPGLIRLYRETYPDLPMAELVPNAPPYPGPVDYDGRLHRAAGLPGGAPVLLYQGGLWKERGIEDVTAASHLLPGSWHTVLMGYGDIAGQLPTHDRLHILPPAPQGELPLWTAGATLGAIPYPPTSLNNIHCLPNKLWEYPLAGVPVIARDLPDMGGIIRREGIGVFYEGGGEAMANAVARLSGKQLVTLRRACSDFAARSSWNQYGSKYLYLVENLATRGTRQP